MTRFAKTTQAISVGHAAMGAMHPPSVSAATVSSPVSFMSPDCLDQSDILILIQAAIVQEWQIYLDSIFEASLEHLLKSEQQSRLPFQLLDLRDIDPKSKSSLRKSVARAAREGFAFQRYDEKVKVIRKLFDAELEEDRLHELKKHVEIRNLFQHNRGTVRETDLQRIGRAEFEIRDGGGSATPYRAGQTIHLAQGEIAYLVDSLETISEHLEVLK
jgi:hypothetical protein